jgi:hypothetical protein
MLTRSARPLRCRSHALLCSPSTAGTLLRWGVFLPGTRFMRDYFHPRRLWWASNGSGNQSSLWAQAPHVRTSIAIYQQSANPPIQYLLGRRYTRFLLGSFKARLCVRDRGRAAS